MNQSFKCTDVIALIDIAKAIYSANGLAYHNETHINNMLSAASMLLEHKAESMLSSLELAIWYHDVVSNTLRTNNEAKSVELFVDVSKVITTLLGQQNYCPNTVSTLIMVTSNHLLELDGTQLTEEQKIILDSDLAGFSTTPFSAYMLNSTNIRLEYPHLKLPMYHAGRIRFLQKLNSKEHLYYTDVARDSWEAQARLNIEQEIEFLHSEDAKFLPSSAIWNGQSFEQISKESKGEILDRVFKTFPGQRVK